jgi:hypothetical protein
VESNTYLDQVVQEQAKVEGELRSRQRAINWASAPPAGTLQEADSEGPSLGNVPGPGSALDYRITGWWRWKTVIVSPNVYVVHTRRGRAEPLHVGLGTSFRYNPATDAFLIIPAAVQTLLINARCICAERQGVLVQGYVQWVVEDVKTAYRQLDFSDAGDRMRIVNLQLREQAEAAIKDKVATMPIDDVLADKQPIIEELTHRLRTVAEGGLGLKIVTVQIKEAVVSSRRLWENLQRPFRAEREKVARLAELEAQQTIARQELESARQMEERKAEQEREVYNRTQEERVRRHGMEQTAEQKALAERAATEKARRQADDELIAQQHELAAREANREFESVARKADLERARAGLTRLSLEAETEREGMVHRARTDREERDIAIARLRRAVENDLSDGALRAQLVARLPEIAAAMPKPEHLRAVTVTPDGGNTSLAGLMASLLQLMDSAKNWNGTP